MISMIMTELVAPTEHIKPTILIVEDDSYIVTYLNAKLEKRYNTIVAPDAKTARKALAEKQPDLILLDIIMPEEDGFSLLEEIKSHKSPYKDIPVIVLTNLSQHEDMKRSYKLGAAEFLVKANYTLDEIAARIDKVLNRPVARSADNA